VSTDYIVCAGVVNIKEHLWPQHTTHLRLMHSLPSVHITWHRREDLSPMLMTGPARELRGYTMKKL